MGVSDKNTVCIRDRGHAPQEASGVRKRQRRKIWEVMVVSDHYIIRKTKRSINLVPRLATFFRRTGVFTPNEEERVAYWVFFMQIARELKNLYKSPTSQASWRPDSVRAAVEFVVSISSARSSGMASGDNKSNLCSPIITV